ncbi:MAG: DedA family protein [Thermochromatium sp.]
MDYATLISQYGLVAVLVGTVLEGESVLLVAGYAAHRGYLDFPAVVTLAWLGAVLGDQAWFWLGRRHGSWLLARRPGLRARMDGALALISRHPGKAALAMRFAWGLRTALPIAMGMSALPAGRFLALNLLSAAVWAPLIAGLGWSFGALITQHAAQLHRYEHYLAAGLVAAALAIHWFYRRRTARGS